MKRVLPIFFLLLVSVVYSQNYADKEYYLIDSFDLNQLSIHDMAILDSSLKLFHAAKHDTSKINALGIICEEMLNTQWSKYQVYQYNLIEEIPKNHHNLNNWAKKYKATALTNLAYLSSYEFGDNQKGLKYLNESIEIQREIKDLKGLATSYSNLGFIYNILGNVKKALDYHYKSLEIREKLNDKEGIAYCYNNIGSVYYNIDNIDLALEQYQKAQKIRHEINDKKGIANSYSRIAKIYHKKEQLNESLKNYKESLRIHEELGYQLAIAPTLKNIGKVYISMGDLNNASAYLNKSLAISTELEYKDGVAGSLLGLAEINLLENDYSASKENALKALSLFKELNNVNEIASAAKLLSVLYEKQNDIQKAYVYYKLHTNLHDSLTNINRQKEVLQKEFEYEYEKKLLAKKIEFERRLGEDKIKRLNERYTILSFITLIILIAGGYIRSRYIKNLRERERLLHEIELLKEKSLTKIITSEERSNKLELNKDKIEAEIEAKLNESDWKILNILFNDPIIANKEIANQVALSIEGTSSSLRKMYRLFNLGDSKNKKLALVIEATRISGKN